MCNYGKLDDLVSMAIKFSQSQSDCPMTSDQLDNWVENVFVPHKIVLCRIPCGNDCCYTASANCFRKSQDISLTLPRIRLTCNPAMQLLLSSAGSAKFMG